MSQAEAVPTLARIRLTFARREALRYVSHLDMLLVWERTLRRAGVPLAYSKGFNPKPRLHQAAALPLGFLSRCEITDFWLEIGPDETEPDLAEITRRVQDAAPPGMEILNSETVALSLPALQTLIESAEYLAQPMDSLDAAGIAQAVEHLLNAQSLPRERRGKAYDLRPLVEALEIRSSASGQLNLYMRLAAREGATGRPEEVLAVLGLDAADFRVERVALLLKNETGEDNLPTG